MAYPIRYSNRAYSEYASIIEYIIEKFGIEIAKKVDNYFEEVIIQISINPLLFPYSDKKKNLRRCVISPQTTLYYRFGGEYIEIVSFRGNKMNPKTLEL
ncbi:MAG TPA: type II toxin-antitoxin system RelE/ParE family toxin [Prolixibacteraceae bacterium]|nr:type II toxin-antitoxin system RelE/ParE family toxin [Prolixibacteraceae bacterium]